MSILTFRKILNNKTGDQKGKLVRKHKIDNKRNAAGFTMIELLIVVIIISILATTVITLLNYGRQIDQAKNAQRAVDLKTLDSAVQQYYIDNLDWPASLTSDGRFICRQGQDQNLEQQLENPAGDEMAEECISLDVLVPEYLSAIPHDPDATSTNTLYKIAINPISQKPILTAQASVELETDSTESFDLRISPWLILALVVLVIVAWIRPFKKRESL